MTEHIDTLVFQGGYACTFGWVIASLAFPSRELLFLRLAIWTFCCWAVFLLFHTDLSYGLYWNAHDRRIELTGPGNTWIYLGAVLGCLAYYAFCIGTTIAPIPRKRVFGPIHAGAPILRAWVFAASLHWSIDKIPELTFGTLPLVLIWMRLYELRSASSFWPNARFDAAPGNLGGSQENGAIWQKPSGVSGWMRFFSGAGLERSRGAKGMQLEESGRMLADYRTARPEEREEYIDLANYAFRFDFETFMPKVYGKNIDSSSIHKVAVDPQGRLRAQVAVLPEKLTVCGCALRAGFVGTVSVHPRARGEGHMKALMNRWLEEMHDAYDLAVLNGQRQRYEYFGFTRGGVQHKYIVLRPNIRHALRHVTGDRLSFCPLFEVEDADAFAQRINTARLAYVERDAQQLPATFKTLHQKPVAVLEDNSLIGYLIASKAGHEISELAMEKPDDIPRVIKAYMAHLGAEKVSVITPDYDLATNMALGDFAEDCVLESFFMYNILDFARVLEAYLTVKHRTTGLTAGEFSAVLDGQSVTACVDEGGVTVHRTAKPGAVALGKGQAQTLLLTTHGRYMGVSAPADWFPLPVFWYKIDSF